MSVETGLKWAARCCQTIDQILLDTAILDALSIAKSLARQLQVPFMRLKDIGIPGEATSLLSKKVAKTHLLVPLKVSEGRLLVAMANPLDADAVKTLRLLTKMKIEVAVTTREDILQTLARAYPVEFLDQVLKELPMMTRSPLNSEKITQATSGGKFPWDFTHATACWNRGRTTFSMIKQRRWK